MLDPWASVGAESLVKSMVGQDAYDPPESQLREPSVMLCMSSDRAMLVHDGSQ